MSLRYRMLERCIKAVDIHRIYSKPENELMTYLQTKHRAYDLPEFMYKHFNVEKNKIDGKLYFKVTPKQGANKNVILFLHGGGGMMCPTLLHYKTAARLINHTGAALYFPFYPLGPEASIFESMEWLDKVYAQVLKNHSPQDVTVIGDSAGAALSVSLCRRNSAKPKGIVLISPPVGLEKNDGKMREKENDDIILSVKTIDIVKKYWIKEASFDGADFNVLGTDFSQFPPVQLYYGTNELFYPYIDELIEKISSDGAQLEAHKGEGLCHDWVLIGIIPEEHDALENICAFVKR